MRLSVIRKRQVEDCCERYAANDGEVGRWLAAAVRLSLMYNNFWLIMILKYSHNRRDNPSGCPSIHSKLKTGEHSSPLRYNIKI